MRGSLRSTRPTCTRSGGRTRTPCHTISSAQTPPIWGLEHSSGWLLHISTSESGADEISMSSRLCWLPDGAGRSWKRIATASVVPLGCKGSITTAQPVLVIVTTTVPRAVIHRIMLSTSRRSSGGEVFPGGRHGSSKEPDVDAGREEPHRSPPGRRLVRRELDGDALDDHAAEHVGADAERRRRGEG